MEVDCAETVLEGGGIGGGGLEVRQRWLAGLRMVTQRWWWWWRMVMVEDRDGNDNGKIVTVEWWRREVLLEVDVGGDGETKEIYGV